MKAKGEGQSGQQHFGASGEKDAEYMGYADGQDLGSMMG